MKDLTLEFAYSKKGWRDEPRSLIKKIVRARDGNELGTIEEIDQDSIIVRPIAAEHTVSLPFDFLDHIQGKMVFLKVTSQELPENVRNMSIISPSPTTKVDASSDESVESPELSGGSKKPKIKNQRTNVRTKK